MRQFFRLLLFLTLFFIPGKNFSQAPPVFDLQKCLGGSGLDVANKIIPSSTGGTIVIGSTNSVNGDVTFNHGSDDVWVARLDSNENIIWQKSFGGTGSDQGVSGVEFDNGNIYVLANTSSTNGDVTNNHGSTDIWVIGLHADGTLFFRKTIGGSGNDKATCLLKAIDNSLLIGGATFSNNGDVSGNHGSEDLWLIDIDTLGNRNFQQCFGGAGVEECYSIAQCSDGGFIAAGYSDSNDGDVTLNQGGHDFWVVKTNSAGQLSWQKSFGGSSNDAALAVLQSTNGSFIVGGYSNSIDGDITDNHGSSDYWILTLDGAGNMIRQLAYGGTNSDVAYSMIQTEDGGYMIVGGTTSNNFDVSGNHGFEDFWLLKTDSMGSPAWSRTYGGSISERALSVFQSSDLGFAVVGYTYSNNGSVSGNHGGGDIWTLKLSCLFPAADFVLPHDTVCIFANESFTNTSVNSAVYEWQINGGMFSGNENASFQFNATGNYTIGLIGYTCYASDTMLRQITVVNPPSPAVTSSNPYVCTSHSITLSTFSYDSYQWSNGDSLQTTSITAGGFYSVSVTKYGCSGSSATIFIDEHASPSLNFGNDTSICTATNLFLHCDPTLQSYLWQDGSTDSVYVVHATGTYSVTVSNDYCTSSDSINVTVLPCVYPVADFSAGQNSICANSCVDFTNQSTGGTSWSWSFPGAEVTSSTQQSPSACYSIPGIYSVTLIATDSIGSSAMVRSDYILVHELPAIPVINAAGNILTSTQAAAYQWYYDGNPISGATSQGYDATLNGYYYVVVGNEFGCESISDSVYVDATGIQETPSVDVLNIYPNPSTGISTLAPFKSTSQKSILKITDVSGKLILEKSIFCNTSTSIDLSGFDAGIYFLQLQTDDKAVFRKLVVSK